MTTSERATAPSRSARAGHSCWVPLALWGAGMLSIPLDAFAQDVTPGSKKSKHLAIVVHPPLSPAEQQQLNFLKLQFVTPYNSKENPGDQRTWFVIGYWDAAIAETQSREAAPMILGGVMWSDQRTRQRHVVKDVVILQGRTAAALSVMEHLNVPNQAVLKLHSPSTAAREGWLKRQATQVAGQRLWEYRAFDSEGAARQFLENVRPAK